jgi:hypothetical protein
MKFYNYIMLYYIWIRWMAAETEFSSIERTYGEYVSAETKLQA